MKYGKHILIVAVLVVIVCFTAGCALGKDGAQNEKPPVPAAPYADSYGSEAVLYFPFDEEQGKAVFDKSPAKRGAFIVQGNLLSSPAYQSAAVEPQRTTRSAVNGRALYFDGYSEQISIPAQTFSLGGNAFTVDVCVAPRSFLWAAPQSAREDWAVQVIAGQFSRKNKTGFMLGITKFGYWVFGFGTGKEWVNVYNSAKSTCLSTYEWNHLTAVFNGNEGYAEIYLNGISAAKVSVPVGSSVAKANVPFLVGSSNEPEYSGQSEITRFNGVMDELKIYGLAKPVGAIRTHHEGLFGYNGMRAEYEDIAPLATRLAHDKFRPAYHAVPPANWMNEPHALFCYNDKWHLFYQYNVTGPYWRQISWGHWVSDDGMATWRSVKEAIIPTEGTPAPDGIWTGGMAYDTNGLPVLFFTAGDDSRPFNNSNQHIGIARAADYSDPDLTEWIIDDTLAVVQTGEMGVAGEFRDPQVQKIGSTYYMLVGGAVNENGKQRGMAHVFTSDGDFHKWEYRGELFVPASYKSEYGTVWEMPNIARLPDENGKLTDKYIFLFSPQHGDNDVWYYIGDFNTKTCRFTPDFPDAKLLDYGNNVFTGPTLFTDPQTHKVYITGITQDARGDEEHCAAGWAHSASCVRELKLLSGNVLGVFPAGLDNLASESAVGFNELDATQAAQRLQEVQSDFLRITYRIRLNGATRAGFRLKVNNNEYAELSFTRSEMRMNTTRFSSGARADVGGELKNDGTMQGVIYVDKASIEAFACDRAVITAFAYGTGTGIVPFGEGGQAAFGITVDVLSPPQRQAY